MKQISNEALLSLLVISIVVSVVGTVSNLNKINSLTPGFGGTYPGVTGLASTGTGSVNLTIPSTASITLIDSTIDFGTCSPNGTIGANLSSNDSSASWGWPGACTVNGSEPTDVDYFTLQNDGNDDVNVSIQSNITIANLIGGTGSRLFYGVQNHSSAPGCNNATDITGQAFGNDDGANAQGFPNNFTEITAASSEYIVCSNLTSTDTTDSIDVYLKVDIPADAASTSGEAAAGLTFTAVSKT